MTVAPIDDALRSEHGLSQGASGLVVVAVAEASEAEDKGIRVGDVIAEAGQSSVETAGDLRDRIEAAEAAGRNSLLLLVRRDGEPRFVALSLSR